LGLKKLLLKIWPIQTDWLTFYKKKEMLGIPFTNKEIASCFFDEPW